MKLDTKYHIVWVWTKFQELYFGFDMKAIIKTKQRGKLRVSLKTLVLWYMCEKVKTTGSDKYEWYNDEKGEYEECEITLV